MTDFRSITAWYVSRQELRPMTRHVHRLGLPVPLPGAEDERVPAGGMRCLAVGGEHDMTLNMLVV